MNQPTKNTSSTENPVGRFMVAAGAVIELENSGKILIVQRATTLDWHPSDWEIIYGRLAQFEDAESGLRREVSEEVGIQDLKILNVLSAWHIFRGQEESAENELIGITYHCRTSQRVPQLSPEHQASEWVTPEEALSRIRVEGIRRDVQKFIDGISKNSQ